jgi:bacteriocin biosynthesis cyclodehydratase domain-containing protein
MRDLTWPQANTDQGQSSGDELLPYFDIGVMEVRPKLLFDVEFHRKPGGIGFRGRNASLDVNWPQAYPVMVDIAPYLAGEQSVAEICGQLDPARVDIAVALIQLLRAKGFLVDRTKERTDIPGHVLERFAPQIEFISQFTDRPLYRFGRFRDSRLLVSGTGRALRAMILAFARNGAAGLLCDVRSLDPTDLERLREQCQSDGPGFRLETVDVTAVLDSSDTGAKLDAFCYASDDVDPLAMASLCGACRSHRVPFVPGALLTDLGFVGPLSTAAGRPCWMCLLMRRCESIAAERSTSVWRALALGGECRSTGTAPDTGHLAGILGNLIAFETFKLLVGHLPVEIDGYALTLDPESLESGKCRVLPHPLCTQCSSMSDETDRQYLASVFRVTEAEPLDLRARLRALSTFLDATTGIGERFDDERLAQVPLFQSSIIFRERESAAPRSVFGYSLHTHGAAMVSAANALVRHYGRALFDRRRTWVGSASEALRAGYRPISSSTLSGCLLPADETCGERLEWMHALSWQSREPCLVPATAVYACSALNCGIFERTEAGIGVGHSFAEACRDAIRSSIAQDSLKQLAAHRLIPAIPSLSALRSSAPDLELVLTILKQLNMTFQVLTVSHGGLSVAIAFAPAAAVAAQSVAIAVDEHAAVSVAAALTDLLAISLGGHPSNTLDYYLPSALGYGLDICEVQRRSVAHAAADEMNQGRPLRSGSPEIVIANMSTDDIRSAGLTLVKALVIAN